MSQNLSTAVMQLPHVTVDKLDYYPTPPWATRAFLREVLGGHVPFGSVWEPACGEGHMVHVLREFCQHYRTSDVHDYGKGFTVGSYVGSGLDVMPPCHDFDWIVTNPPFNLALEFAERALREARIGVALLLRSAWAEGAGRYNRLFKPYPPRIIAQYCDRVPMVAGRYDPSASSATSYSWFVWSKDICGEGTSFRWIAPGAKDRHYIKDDVRRWAA